VVSTYAPEIAEEIFRRLCEGRSIVEICRDPAMPCAMTVYNWRQKHPEFAELVRLGREVQAELFFDLGWEMAKAATPETAYLTHVRLGHLRWMVGSMAPRIYRIRQVEPEAPPKRQDVLFRHFKVEVDPETGERRVASYVANPETGEVERQDAPGWRRPPGVVMLPGG
jgi:transposase-like protein